MKINEWIEQQEKYSRILSQKENWTPLRKHIARTFLVTGTILGIGLGISIAIIVLKLI